ncbi:YbjQ family protein [[Clostridium] dakarense]|uniref:YbjQ family protein n=1 Tax=Faecalimicrobium dakarense TaxID=1301100 RepID=UPI0004BA1420|nr:heavy metal-binding domain-containing protein [[Clostridium] dakarense]
MLILTINDVPGKKITKVVGLVKGSTIRSKHIGKDIGASFKQLVGGELTGYDEMLVEARKIAIGRMVEDAEAQGANAIIGFRLTSAAVMQGAAEMLAYGTAVVIEDGISG